MAFNWLLRVSQGEFHGRRVQRLLNGAVQMLFYTHVVLAMLSHHTQQSRLSFICLSKPSQHSISAFSQGKDWNSFSQEQPVGLEAGL